MPPLERVYQTRLIKRIKKMFPGCFVLKNDSGYLPGVPDWIILANGRFAFLEIKREKPKESDWQPNQQYYIRLLNQIGYAACIYPENEEEILREVQNALSR